jgi:hypothetical protein
VKDVWILWNMFGIAIRLESIPQTGLDLIQEEINKAKG